MQSFNTINFATPFALIKSSVCTMQLIFLLTLPCIVSASAMYQGFGTVYTLTSPFNGNCNFMHSPDEAGTKYAALNAEQWEETMNCGRCVEVSCTDPTCADRPSEVVHILDQCPGCGYGGLDLSPEVFEKITGQTYTILPIEWKFVDCPVSSNVEYCLKTGSTEFWVAVQPTNLDSGVTSMKIDNQETSRVDSAFYFLIDGKGKSVANLSALSISLTNVNGEVLEDTLSMKADLCTAGSSQFSPSGDIYQTTTISEEASQEPNSTACADVAPTAPDAAPSTACPPTATPTTTPPLMDPNMAPQTEPPPNSPPLDSIATETPSPVTDAPIVPPFTESLPALSPISAQVPLQTVFTVAETSTHSTPISDNLGFADHLHQLYHSGDVASGPSSILTLQESTLSQQSGNKGFTVASPATSISEASVQDDTSSKNPFSSTIAVIAFVATACVVTGTVVGVAVALHKKRRLLEECKNDNGDMSDDSLGSNFVHVSTPRHQALMMQSVV